MSDSPDLDQVNDATPIRRGAVAVVVREGRFLVICRSQTVVAPGALCFPGGGLEGDETAEQALVREMQEELGASIRPLRCVWRYVTKWNADLDWWLGEFDDYAVLEPNLAEVAAVHWMTPEEALAHPHLLESNRAFFAALTSGEITL